MVSLYQYNDFRIYLKDFYEAQANKIRNYSYRQMAAQLGFSSPNYLNQIISGKRNLGLKSINRLIEGLPFKSKKEKEYFNYLVFFGQAKTQVEKNYYFGLLSSLKSPVTSKKLSQQQYEYYSTWYHCVVRELVVRGTGEPDYHAIAQNIKPEISTARVRKSVALLEDLGLIKKLPGGGYDHSSRLIETDREVNSLAVRNFHRNMIELGRDAIDTVKGRDREVSSITMSVSREMQKKLKKRIQEFEDEIMQMVRSDKNVSDVYQLNLQLFPLTGRKDDE